MKKFRLKVRHNRATTNLVTALLIMILSLLGIELFNPNLINQLSETIKPLNPGFYEVVEVNDGDTITVKANGRTDRVRLIGIDTPEKNHPEKPVQCFAEAASQRLEQLIGQEAVGLEADPLNTNRDRYDRLLRYVYTADGELLNRTMVKEGYAFAYLAFPFSRLEEFERLEGRARELKLGLWRECSIELESGFPQTNDDDL